MNKKEKLIHELFVGKVADEIGFKRTLELLTESKQAFKHSVEVNVNNSDLIDVIYTHCTCTIPSLNYGGGKKECNKCGKVPNCI